MVETIKAQNTLEYLIKDDKEVYVSYNGQYFRIGLIYFDRKDIKGLRVIMRKIRAGQVEDIYELHTALKSKFCLRYISRESYNITALTCPQVY